MAANINPEEGLAYELSLIEQAKVLIEKLDTMAQRSSAHLAHEHTHIESTVPDDFTDNASELSGYSLLTPSATSNSERNEGTPSSEQQFPVEDQTEFDEIPELVPGEPLNFDLDASDFYENGKGSQPIEQAQEDDDKNAPQTESEPASKKQQKLIGVVITFDQGVDFEKGQTAVRFIGDHLGLSCGSQVKEIRVLSIEGDGHLEVVTPPSAELQPGSMSPGHEAVELVAKIHRTNEKDGQEDHIQGRVATVSIDKSSLFSSLVEPASAPAVPTDKTSLTLHRTELAKARTLSALLGLRNAACSGNCFDTSIKEAAKTSDINGIDTPPTLSQLIEIAKAKIHEEVKHHECHVTPGASKRTCTKQKKLKTKQTKLAKNKGASRLTGERLVISCLSLAVTFLALCIMAMSAGTPGHCVGFWIGA